MSAKERPQGGRCPLGNIWILTAIGRRSNTAGFPTNNPVRGFTLGGKLVGPASFGMGVAVGGAGVDVTVGVGLFVGVAVEVGLF
jgi:hypothetical protein